MDFSLRHIEHQLRLGLPVASVLFFMLLAFMPWPWEALRHVLSVFVLISLCFWVIHQPQFFSMRWSFIIGILQDIISGETLGVAAFSYIAVDFFLRNQRHVFLRQPFPVYWLGFAMTILAVLLLQALIAHGFMNRPVDFHALLFHASLGILLLPLFVRFLHGLESSVQGRTE